MSPPLGFNPNFGPVPAITPQIGFGGGAPVSDPLAGVQGVNFNTGVATDSFTPSLGFTSSLQGAPADTNLFAGPTSSTVSSPSLTAPGVSGPTADGSTTGEEVPSLGLLIRREISKLFGVQPPDKEYIKHKTDDYSDYWAALGYES